MPKIQVVHRWSSIAQTAEYLGVDSETVRRYMASGRLTGYRMGKRLIRIDLNEVDQMMRPIVTVQGSVA